MQDAQSGAIIKNGMFNLRVSSGCRCCYFSYFLLKTKMCHVMKEVWVRNNYKLDNLLQASFTIQ